jgi:N-acetylmuramoyl-L-alanine amidase/Papain-like cysteine protease AvrRpt2
VAIQIRPTRNEVSRSFPVLGFTVRTGHQHGTYEIVLATDPALMRPAGKSARTRQTFWSSRERGPLPAPRGEAVFLVPPDVLARFVGRDRLYYGIAVFSDSEPNQPKLVLPPEGAAPYVVLSKSFDGQTRRLGTGTRRRETDGYGTRAESLTWAGDLPAAGAVEPVSVAAREPVPVNAGVGSVSDSPASPPTPAASSSTPAAEQAYSDGLGDQFWQELEAEVGEEDNYEVGPIPDDDHADGPALIASGLDAPTPEDPFASRFEPAATSNYRVTAGQAIRRIIIHITDGGRRIAGTIEWFQNPKSKVSAHYVIGQDGEIVQMVRHADVPRHAHDASAEAIGIEHVANTKGLKPTTAQYEASARLVAWLCNRYAIPIDREHILGHAEADEKTTHKACPNAVWDWDHDMALFSAAAGADAGQPADGGRQPADGGRQPADGGYPVDAGQRVDGGQPVDAGRPVDAGQALGAPMDVYYDDCYLVPQPTDGSCWAAAATMVYSWTHRMSHDPAVLAKECGRISQLADGLPGNDIADLAQQLGLTYVWPQSYSVQGFYDLLKDNGPLFVGLYPPKLGPHTVCVVGMYGDGTPGGTTVIYHDPLPVGVGESNKRASFTQFMAEYENAAPKDPDIPLFPYVFHGNGRRRSAALSLGLAPSPAYQASESYSYRPNGSDHRNGYGHPAGGATVAPAMGAPAAAGIMVGEAVASAVVTTVLGNSGDVSWSLAQMTTPHHPGGDPSKAGEGPYRPTGPIQMRGPRGSTLADGDEIYADFEISWETNGRSIGSVTISPAVGGVNDAAGAALDVRTVLTPMMTELPGPATNPSATMAGVQVQFQYAFTYSWASTTTALIDVELHGDGTFRQSNRW